MSVPSAERSAGTPGPIGFVGLGAMGGPMARRLASLGYNVLAYDIDPATTQAVTAAGASLVGNPKELADRASLVFTCLPSLVALRAVLDGPQGLRGDALRTVVDCSTTGSEFAQEMAQRLGERGVMLLDAPITGNVVTAGNGKLGIMCSGPRAAFEQAEPPMRDLAGAIVLYLGERNGQAQRLKLLNNLLSATGMAASCEAFILGVKCGLDPQSMLEIVNAGEASSSATRNKFASSVLPRKFAYGARMAITAKDTSLTVKEAEDLGVPMWIGQAVQQVWKYAASQGGADLDGTSLITFLEPWAGVEVSSRAMTDAAPAQPAADHQMPACELVVLCEAQQVSALAARLAQQGWRVAPESADPPAAGERWCRLLTVDAGCDPASLLRPSGAKGRIVVNACLVGTQRAQQLCQALTEQGDGYADALLAGTASQIEQGCADIVAGGPAARSTALSPWLAAMGRKVFVVSDRAGDAQLMQLLNAGLADTLLAVTCEAYVAGAKSGLDPLTMKRILGLETGRNAASEHIIPERVATRRFDHGKSIGQAARELSLLSDEARRSGVTTWILDKARLLYALAARLGSPDDDITRLATHYEKWAGTQVRVGAPLPAERPRA